MDTKQVSQTLLYETKDYHTAKKSPPTIFGVTLISET